jgi:hypothetical protein
MADQNTPETPTKPPETTVEAQPANASETKKFRTVSSVIFDGKVLSVDKEFEIEPIRVAELVATGQLVEVK